KINKIMTKYPGSQDDGAMHPTGFSESMNACKAFFLQSKSLYQAFTFISNHAGGMGFIHYHISMVLLTKINQLLQGCLVTIHRKHGFSDHENIAGCHFELFFQVFQVIMTK